MMADVSGPSADPAMEDLVDSDDDCPGLAEETESDDDSCHAESNRSSFVPLNGPCFQFSYPTSYHAYNCSDSSGAEVKQSRIQLSAVTMEAISRMMKEAMSTRSGASQKSLSSKASAK
jgi:hypothetical protein